MKAGGRGFESHLSSLFSMKTEKTALRFVALFAFKSLSSHVCVCVCVCVCVHVLPIEGLVVQGQPVVIWCSVFLLAAVAAVTI